MGCGIGVVTEYIYDLTGAHITGIDLAAEAIRSAQERTKGKKNRLVFQEGDLNNLDLPAASFNRIIAIDTLYFVDDLERLADQMKAILQPNGQMGIFYSQMIRPEDSKELLLPKKTKLAQALKKHNLDFQTFDYTEKEHELWLKEKQVAEELKSEFEAEGNIDLYNSRIEESDYVLKFIESGRSRRYLYHVR